MFTHFSAGVRAFAIGQIYRNRHALPNLELCTDVDKKGGVFLGLIILFCIDYQSLANMTNVPIKALHLHLQRQLSTVLNNVSWELQPGQHWAITGPSGSGKTVLAQVLTGRLQCGGELYYGQKADGHTVQIGWVPQQHQFTNRSHLQQFYYQQRFNATESADSLSIREYLQLAPTDTLTHTLLQQLQLMPLLDRPLIQLSNGENKRLQLVQALRQQPDILVLDNPFTGLDRDGRALLNHVMLHWAAQGMQWIVVTAADRLPVCTTHVAVMESGEMIFQGPLAQWQIQQHEQPITPVLPSLPGLTTHWDNNPLFRFTDAIRMKNVSVQYNDKTILSQINWTVARSERWSVSGPNGAGKSTLLSLITADNPQAYANEIYLFDQRRGTGESIWDIKKRIGFVSPELHLYFDRTATVRDVVASGLFDTMGLFRQLHSTQEQWVQQWLQWMELQAVAAKPLFQLPLGIQRMTLLARAFIKLPPLLILDEPCQGLDHTQSVTIKAWIDHISHYYPLTLLYVTHYADEIPGCVTRHLQLQNGHAQLLSPVT